MTSGGLCAPGPGTSSRCCHPRGASFRHRRRRRCERGKKGALEEIAARAAGKKREATKIVVFSTKGGTGKTSWPQTWGLGWPRRETRGDRGSGSPVRRCCHRHGAHPQRTLYDLVQTYSEIDLSLLDEFMLKHPSVSTCCGPTLPDQAEKVTLEDVKAILDVVQEGYDFVIVTRLPL